MTRLTAVLTVALSFGLFTVACDSGTPRPGAFSEDAHPDAPQETPATASPSSMMNSNAPFPVFHQGFNHGAEPWSQFTKQGGWCGTVERRDRGHGDVAPSAGRGYAVIAHDRCIDFFVPQTSAPASGPTADLISSTWPPGGFVQQVDVYLKPGYPAGADGPDYDDPEDGTLEGQVYAPDGSLVEKDEDAVFTYATSLCVLAEDGSCPIPRGLRYFSVSVTKDEAGLDVAGHTVTEPGWYTLRYVFGSDGDGRLTVDFQLVDNGRPLVTKPVETTMAATPFSPITETSSFEVADLGSGYLWFASIADGLTLPIDEHRLRRGK